LLAIAQDASVKERPHLRGEWIFVYETRADAGPVLTPMVQRSGRDPHDLYLQVLTNQVAQRLSVDTDARIRRASEKTLHSWTMNLVREGSERLHELGAHDESGDPAVRALREGVVDAENELWLARTLGRFGLAVAAHERDRRIFGAGAGTGTTYGDVRRRDRRKHWRAHRVLESFPCKRAVTPEVFKTSAVVQPTARSVRLRRRSAETAGGKRGDSPRSRIAA